MTDKKSYYAVIPANIRYDETLSPNAKLLYGEITALCNNEGYCWASNKYFADLYGVSIASIKRWIKALIDNGYITSRLIHKEGNNKIDTRYIQICTDPGIKNEPPLVSKMSHPGIKNEPDNNTYINNTFNNTNEYIYMSDKPTPKQKHKQKNNKQFIPPTVEEIRAYCEKRKNNVDAQKFFDYYDAAEWYDGKGEKVKSWKQKVITWENRSHNTNKPAEQKSSGNVFLDLINEGVYDD